MPVLWDKKTGAIVNNESSEIIRMLNTGFNNHLPADKAAIDLYPESLRKEIDEVNEWVYDTVNSRCMPITPTTFLSSSPLQMACTSLVSQRRRRRTRPL